MTNILVFDKWSKYELFKEYVGKRVRNMRFHYSFDPEDAIEKIKKIKPDILVLGGDVHSDEMKAVLLAGRMKAEKLWIKYTFISTWNPEEAETLRKMINKSFYCPFSQSLVNIVKKRAQNLDLYKGKERREAARRERMEKIR
jgi:chemotaxis response regulator CheB